MQAFPRLPTFWAVSLTISSGIFPASSSTAHCIGVMQLTLLNASYLIFDVTPDAKVKAVMVGGISLFLKPFLSRSKGSNWLREMLRHLAWTNTANSLINFVPSAWLPLSACPSVPMRSPTVVVHPSTIHLTANIFPSTTPHHAINVLSPCLLHTIFWCRYHSALPWFKWHHSL